MSDNGKQYDNNSIREYFETNKIQQILVPEYTPSSNGISERINKTITFTLIANKQKTMEEIVETAENTLNLNYNRMLGGIAYSISYRDRFL